MSVEGLLSALLVHPERVTSDALGASSPDDLVAGAEREHVVPQVRDGLERMARDSRHLDAMRTAARRWALYEAVQRRAIGEVLDAAAGARLLFFKGASLAYSTYAAPFARMRQDWDILVPEGDAATVERALLRCGFAKDLKTPGRIRVRQHSYRRDVGEGECAVDLHTGVFNAPGMAARVRFEALYESGMPLPALHRSARGTSEADALVIACLHRLVHHSGDPRLIWDYDVHLLVQRLRAAFDDVMARAAAWRVEALVAREISRVASRLDAPLPPEVAEGIRRVPPDAEGFARENRSRAADFMLDWRALGWRDRVALVRETFLPDPAFVRASSGSSMPLPWLYVRRLAKGASAWLRPARRSGK